MLINLYKTRVLLFGITAFLLCQCTTAVNSPTPLLVPHKKVANPFPLAASDYLAQAKEQDGQAKQDALLLAAGRLIFDNQWRQGAAILAQTSDLSAEQKNEKNILLAKIEVIRDNPKLALAKLDQISDSASLSGFYQIQFHELLAQSHRVAGNYSESLAQRVALDHLLTDKDSQLENERSLWLTLSNLPQAELDTLAAESVNKTELHGWFQLALIARKYRNNANSLLAALDQWQTRNSNHPGNNLLPNPLDSIANKLLVQPKHVALLLPLSGALSGPGKAIQDGFMAAYKANHGEETTQIKTYDTDKGDITATYQQAISEGAEYVVGPLTKNQVATIAAISHPVPTLLLNETDVAVQDNSYFFGLSPTNEAMQVASKARSKGYKRALIIAPKNDWGKEVTKAFVQKWEAEQGQVTDTLSYGATDDLNKTMQNFLQITRSQAREKQLKQLLGQDLQTSISRRQDFDMIFLLAYPSKARQIMPLLKYYYAGDVPVYATSSVYAGSANALKDKDLDGLIFCDIPWVFSHQMGTRNWPEQFNSYNRLYALGMDSYALATQLNQLMLFPADGSKDKNGTLYLKSTQQVARVLEWGQFKQGLAHSLG